MHSANDYTLIRSKQRKTISIQIRNATIIVRAPHGVSENFIHDLIAKKQNWIEKHTTIQKQKQAESDSNANESLYYKGIVYQKVYSHTHRDIHIDHEYRILSIPAGKLEQETKVLEPFLKGELEIYL